MKKLIFIVGPTASGKTAEAIRLAQQHHTEIVSCDSRQFYRELNIGVARPTEQELQSAPHHFIACRTVQQAYNVYEYEHEALQRLDSIFSSHDVAVAVGGSGLYADALVNGIALLPDPAPGLREQLKKQLDDEGIESFRQQLQHLDPDYYARVDLNNPVRLQRAIEVCLTAGRPYSQIIAEQQRQRRPFCIELRTVQRDNAELRQRIEQRVDQMLSDGLLGEVRQLWHLQHLVPLQTVGYREFFAYPTPEVAEQHLGEIAAQIKLSTWHYAKKQITWFKKMLANANQSNTHPTPPTHHDI